MICLCYISLQHINNMTADYDIEDFYNIYVFKDYISHNSNERYETLENRGHVIDYILKNVLDC